MPWSRREKALIHIYKAAAAIEDQDYRELLREATGCTSAADGRLNQGDFESAMATLETRLVWAIDQGLVPRPAAGKIKAMDYWRRRQPVAHGAVTGRQLRLISHQVAELQRLVTVGNWDTYLIGVIKKATGRAVPVLDLKVQEAGKLIDALKDRLSYARPQQ
jgi:hypothetical protein